MNGKPAKPATALEDRLGMFETEPRSGQDVARWLDEGFPLVVLEDGGEVVAWASAPPHRPRERGEPRTLSRALGFREVGVYKRHAKLDGEWRDTVIVELLLGG